MIAHITGTIMQIKEHAIVLNVSNIGFEIVVASVRNFVLHAQTSLFIVFYWNQENGPQLFGFLQESEKTVFNLVISCSGCGPKIGLSVVDQMSLGQFVLAIEKSDIGALSSVSGIGKKKAEQIILSLKDKVIAIEEYDIISQATPAIAHIKKIDDVLTSLGYTRQEIIMALEFLKKQDFFDKESFDFLLRKALGHLSKK